MLIARPNFKFIREVQPTISFTLSHLEGKEMQEGSLKIKNLKCFEIQYQATGHIALLLLSSSKEMSKTLEVVDMHVTYKRGLISFHILTVQKQEKVEEFVGQKGHSLYTFFSVNRKRRNLSRWLDNKNQINQEYQDSGRIQKFVSNLSKNQYKFKELSLN